MTLVAREHFRAGVQRRYAEYEISEFGRVRLQSLTEQERAAYEVYPLGKDGETDRDKLKNMRSKLITLCVVNKDGHRELTAEDVSYINDLDSGVVAQLFEACAKHCMFSTSDVAALVKNSDTTTGEDLPSA